MIFYPPALPCVSKAEGLSASAAAGVVRSPTEVGATRQRRTGALLPHQLELTWMIAQPTALAQFIAWCNANAWDEWVLLTLPGLVASRAGLPTLPTPVRFASDLAQELVAGEGIWYWRVRVTADYLPSADDLEPMPETEPAP